MSQSNIQSPVSDRLKNQSLYILAFKDDGLIKVGLASDPWLRIAALGSARFNLAASYLVRCRDRSSVRILERMLKTFFAEHQVAPEKELSSGNTETFRASILPEILQAIATLRSTFPGAEFQIDRDLSSLVPSQPEKRKGLSLAERQARWLEDAKRELQENERKLKETESILPKLRVQSIQIIEDSTEKFHCDIHLHRGQTSIGEQLLRNPGPLHIDGLLWGVDSLEWSEEDGTCCVGLWFDLKHYAECHDRSLIPSDIAERAVALWRDFVAKHSDVISQS